jgi:SnoaL-like domain
MDRSSVQDWLDRYSRAWESFDPAEVGALFAEGAEYRFHPWEDGDDVIRGREAIVKSWVEPDGSASTRDPEGTYEGRYEPYAVDGNRAVAVGQSTYWTDASRGTLDRIYHNVYLLEFDGDGRCTSFTELFMKRPASS